jgi:hypothetical protein
MAEMNYPAAETAGYLKGEGQEHRTAYGGVTASRYLAI